MVLTFATRLLILATTIPLLLITAFTGLENDLVRCWDLRKFGADQEPSYLYHKTRDRIIPLAIALWTST